MKKILSLLTSCAAALSFMAAAPASATVLTTPWQSAEFSLDSIDASQNLSFTGFDSTLGTLIGVVIKFTMSETLVDTIYNFTSHLVTVGVPNGVSATSTVTASGPLGLQTVNQLTTTPYTGTIAAGANNQVTATLNDVNSGPSSISGNPSSLAAYIGGTNSVTIAVSSVGSQSGSLQPGVLTGYDGSSRGVVYLQYIYDIPEPASIALFALGLLALTQLRRRKNF
ncbi:choice-of-anchor E domain-containing protein [Herbaspirillum robiniae]|uniref:Choice-of-anchor E domain-containing protein n=1 Tax=Herbaspirillum robiniae TaxID=2014887 RepID=A0ABX2LTE4_9BURK|nr:choice-of-anchor E domain-containing protein [Herbaspirillum robiniae]NUU01822.1 choice-of-anchor E domain-containing protein [Herbaspirillum robiniae]